MFKKILATATMISLMSSMFAGTVFATEWNNNGGSSTVTGENYVVEPVISVELPGDLAFGINPLYLDADGDTEGTPNDNTQIVSGDYLVTNYSNVAVLVTASTRISKVGTNITTVETLTTDSWDAVGELKSNATETNKNVCLIQMLPKAVEVTQGVVKLTPNVLDATAANNVDAKIGGYVLKKSETDGATAAKAMFMLAANPTGELATGVVSGFTFSGAVDPNKTYEYNDVTVSTVFTLNTLTDDQKGGYQGLTLNSANSCTYDGTVVEVKTTSP